jgi:hypothetical protein
MAEVTTNALPVTIGLLVGGLAVVIWAIILVRALLEWKHQQERRMAWVMMAGTAFLASVGTLSSSIGFGIQSGVLDLNVSQPALSFIASVGRGALVMGGLIVLTHARPPKATK